MDQIQPTSANVVRNCMRAMDNYVLDTAACDVDVAAKAAMAVPHPGSMTFMKAAT